MLRSAQLTHRRIQLRTIEKRRYASFALAVQYCSGTHRSAPRSHHFLARARTIVQVNIAIR